MIFNVELGVFFFPGLGWMNVRWGCTNTICVFAFYVAEKKLYSSYIYAIAFVYFWI